MATIMTAEDAAPDAVEGMPPNTCRIALYYKSDVSAVELAHEISRLPQVDLARGVTCFKNYFSITIITNSTNC
ncbi:hypothetical protein HOS16_gp53 [Shigella phage vB_SflS-ISF001]|uniref:Uncharacterized protein n=1 Tax=Shigella phage vB_SflS-ISF001 TaxID=2048005 RepID=A0A2D1GQC3_9CAUD|nr:hypothetical protein HOS16_gp53 [Shigella phage vB_SflS-ISF001]ATN94131.1 hypothetical protein FLXISF001_053 [Shigella phage vB_SflS-ISF001]